MLNPYFFYCGTTLSQINSSSNFNTESIFNCTSSNLISAQKFSQMVKSHQNLLKEFQNVKVQLEQVKQNYQDLKIRMEMTILSDKSLTVNAYKKLKKHFKKNVQCPFDGCSNKYSSRIALNSHLRAKHGRRAIERKKNQLLAQQKD